MEKEIYEMLKDIRPEFDFEESEDFIEDGFLDSFDIITLVDEIEGKFSVLIDGMEILPENFNNISAICNLIERSEKKE